jgi:response regulator RpfG family c-di-GMP phosphodiesterase
MPVMDGYEATERIKDAPDIRHIPIIALTASGMKEDKEKLMHSKFEGFLIKPVKRSDLYRELSRFLNYSRKEEQPEDKEETKTVSPETLKKLPEILTQLENEFKPLWESVRSNNSIADIHNFGNKIKLFGEKYSLTAFQKFGDNLILQAKIFDIENIGITLESYPGLVEKIRELTIEN